MKNNCCIKNYIIVFFSNSVTGSESAIWATQFLRSLLATMPEEQANMVQFCLTNFIHKQECDLRLIKIFCQIVRDAPDTDLGHWTKTDFSIKSCSELLRKLCEGRYDDLPMKIR